MLQVDPSATTAPRRERRVSHEERARAENVDVINRQWYATPKAVEAFADDDLLEPSLALIFIRCHETLVDAPVLDIGVGAGRTTLYLSQLTREYVGIDNSDAMVEHCRRRFPAARFELCDARDLGMFSDSKFRFVLFSFAGLDAVAHPIRMRALREIARVTEPGGTLAFSSHNRAWLALHAPPAMARSRNPLTQVAHVVRWTQGLARHARMRPLEFATSDYELVNDPAHGYALLHYYATRDTQREQLESVGFTPTEVYDHAGRLMPKGADDSHAPWLWYVATRDD